MKMKKKNESTHVPSDKSVQSTAFEFKNMSPFQDLRLPPPPPLRTRKERTQFLNVIIPISSSFFPQSLHFIVPLYNLKK